MAFPPDETFRRASSFLQAGKLADAERAFKELLRAQPRHVGALNLLAILLTQLGRFAEAEDYVRRALAVDAASDVTFYNYGLILKSLKRPAEALQQFSQALAINALVSETWNNRGTVFNELKRPREAIADFDKALSIKANYPDALCNKGKSLAGLKLYDQALGAYDKALALNPALGEAWIGRGNVHSELNRYNEALAAYDKATTIKGHLAEAWLGRGNVHTKLRQYDLALAAYEKALTSRADLAEAWAGRGNVYMHLKQYNDASVAYDKALTLDADLAEAWLGHGNVQTARKHYDAALAAYDKALNKKEDFAEAWLCRGTVFMEVRQYEDAFAAYDKAFTLKPDLDFVEGHRLFAKLNICDWTDLDGQFSHLIATVRSQTQVVSPFAMLCAPASASDQLQCAKRYIADLGVFPKPARGEIHAHDRIRIAYLSADLHEHATAYLMAGLFEAHDKTRFDVTGISFGPDDQSDMRRRLENSFENFVDVGAASDQEIAELIKRREIDIAVDLKGFTSDGRPGVFAKRQAPIQVNYLGYPGTMGSDDFDYIIADKIIIPDDQRAFYSEHVVWLPDAYQANDKQRRIAEQTPNRSQCGLPDSGIVFCSFNNSYKITPDVFNVWMRLLQAIEGSVLWLIEGSPTASANLRREAERRGVSPARLVFAPRQPLADHLARHRLADLFLDTLPYNAHTTASDALWAGLPVLTCLGSTFPGRVAASLLYATGLDELVTATLDDYEALARKLVRDPQLLGSLKAKLERNRLSCPLFDTKRFARHIEAAYVTMWEKHRRGQPAEHFAVDAIEKS